MASRYLFSSADSISLPQQEGSLAARTAMGQSLQILIVSHAAEHDFAEIAQAVRQHSALICVDVGQAMSALDRGFAPDVAVIDLRGQASTLELAEMRSRLGQHDIAVVDLKMASLDSASEGFLPQIDSGTTSNLEHLLQPGCDPTTLEYQRSNRRCSPRGSFRSRRRNWR